MLPKEGHEPKGCFVYVVLPLEGLWDTIDQQPFDYAKKDNLKWTLMIMQPKFVPSTLFEDVRLQLLEKKDPEYLHKVSFQPCEEGLCAQIMHLGLTMMNPKLLPR